MFVAFKGQRRGEERKLNFCKLSVRTQKIKKSTSP